MSKFVLKYNKKSKNKYYNHSHILEIKSEFNLNTYETSKNEFKLDENYLIPVNKNIRYIPVGFSIMLAVLIFKFIF